MKCKHSEINCITKIINQEWEEIRACEHGISCYLEEKQAIRVL